MSLNPLPLSIWATQVAPSPTLAVDSKAKAMVAAGEDVCGFGAGEPDFDTPDFIKEACIEALRKGQTKYAPAAGIEPLRKALAEKFSAENGIPTDASQVVVSAGGKFSCYLAIVATCGPGDEALLPAPFWVSFPEMIKLAGARPVILPTGFEAGYKVTPAQVEAAITPRTRLLILNSPSNPSGVVYTRAEMEALMAVALKHRLWVMSDEMYERLTYDGVKHHSPASFSEECRASVVTVGGFSKTYSMTGWRLGTLTGPKALVKQVIDLQSQMTSNATTFAQFGALAALVKKEEAAKALAEMTTVFDRRRRFLHGALSSIPGVRCQLAQGAFYLFPDISGTGLDSQTFATRVLEEEKVAVVPGSAFGDDRSIRLSYATSDAVLTKGVERLSRFCARLRG
jgi:aspartate aminotransferase